MSIEGTRRVVETTDQTTANQYLRFGWTLINQYMVEATPERPAAVCYVLASIRRLEDTRQIVVVSDPLEVNRLLELGWRLIDKHVTTADSLERNEVIHFVLAWQSEERPRSEVSAESPGEIELDLPEQDAGRA